MSSKPLSVRAKYGFAVVLCAESAKSKRPARLESNSFCTRERVSVGLRHKAIPTDFFETISPGLGPKGDSGECARGAPRGVHGYDYGTRENTCFYLLCNMLHQFFLPAVDKYHLDTHERERERVTSIQAFKQRFGGGFGIVMPPGVYVD